jgi:drug/metabolite transporter (DMT)-like permease
MNARRFAVQLMVAQGVLFAAETAAIHQIGSRASFMQLALLRGGAGVVLAVAMARHAGIAVFRTSQPGLQALRGTVTLLYMWVMIYSFAHMPFADATAISYTQAAYIAIFSVVILGETVTRMRWGAAALGIAGALLIAKPAFASWNSVYVLALLGTSLNGLAFVLNKYLQRQDTEATTMFYTNLVTVLGNLPALVMTGLPAPEILVWLPGLIVLGPVGMYLGIVAVRHANASMLGPYTLLRLVIGILAGVLIFHELPDMLSACGAALILASCVISAGVKIPRLTPRRAAAGGAGAPAA